MKKQLSLICLGVFVVIISCHKETVNKNIISVSNFGSMFVTFGTPFSAVNFPSKVPVVYNDNSSEELNVTFNENGYQANTAGTYVLEGELSIPPGRSNLNNLKASISVVVSPIRLSAISENGQLRTQYFYDNNGRLDHFTVFNANTSMDYKYVYGTNDRVDTRIRSFGGLLYPEKYFYDATGKLSKIEFYSANNELAQTNTYTYQGNKISRMDNSDQTVNGLKFRTFQYDANGNVQKITFDFGNPYNFTYLTDKKVFPPYILDLADPMNQIEKPIASFSFVQASTYTSAYEYNSTGYPTKETRTYPLDANRQTMITYLYQ